MKARRSIGIITASITPEMKDCPRGNDMPPIGKDETYNSDRLVAYLEGKFLA